MSKLRIFIGLFAITAVIWLFLLGNEKSPEPTFVEAQRSAQALPDDGWSMMTVAALGNDSDVVLPEGWESVDVSECAHLAPAVAIEQAASINPNGWTSQQLCAWMLANSDELISEVENEQQLNTDTFGAQFPIGAFDSPYQEFSDAELEIAAPNDGVASYVLATRLQYIDRRRSDELFIQSAMQTGLPGPLMAAVFTRDGVDFSRDPVSGSVTYSDPDDVFKAAVLAMTVKHMGYDFRQAGFFMEHVAKAMGPDSTEAVLAESQGLYEQISEQGVPK